MTFFQFSNVMLLLTSYYWCHSTNWLHEQAKNNEKLTFEERASPFITQNFNNILVNSFHAAKIWIGFEFFWISILP